MRSAGSRHTATAAATLVLLGASCTDYASPPTEAMARALLDRIDRAFEAGHAVDYALAFEPTRRILGTAFARSTTALAAGTPLSHRSTIDEFVAIDDIGVALFHADVRSGETAAVTRHGYLTFASTASGPRAHLHVDVDPKGRDHVSGKFSGTYACGACNFVLGSNDLRDWLVVPSPRLETGCIEMVTFYRLDADLQLSIAINHNHEQLDAARLLARLLEAEKVAPLPPIEPWRPAAFAAGLPPGVRGAACDVSSKDDGHVSLRLLTRRTPVVSPQDGRAEISYMLTTRGSQAALNRHRADIEALLATFKLSDPTRPSREVAHTAATAHTASAVEADGTFRNRRHGLTCKGPTSWEVYPRADRGLFGVEFGCPEGRNLFKVTAFDRGARDLPGLRATIEAKLTECLGECGPAAEWTDAEEGNAAVTRVHWHPRATDATLRRWCDVLVFEDCWVLVEAATRDDEAAEMFDAVVASVRRY